MCGINPLADSSCSHVTFRVPFRPRVSFDCLCSPVAFSCTELAFVLQPVLGDTELGSVDALLNEFIFWLPKHFEMIHAVWMNLFQGKVECTRRESRISPGLPSVVM